MARQLLREYADCLNYLARCARAYPEQHWWEQYVDEVYSFAIAPPPHDPMDVVRMLVELTRKWRTVRCPPAIKGREFQTLTIIPRAPRSSIA